MLEYTYIVQIAESRTVQSCVYFGHAKYDQKITWSGICKLKAKAEIVRLFAICVIY